MPFGECTGRQPKDTDGQGSKPIRDRATEATEATGAADRDAARLRAAFAFAKVSPTACSGRPSFPQLPNCRKTEIVSARRCHAQRLGVRSHVPIFFLKPGVPHGYHCKTGAP